MKNPAFAPIRYNRRQVALMVRVAMMFDPDFSRKVREPKYALDLLAINIEQGYGPKAALLRYFNLHRDGEAFAWNPR